MNNKKTLGIIGGVGPLATMLIGEKIVRLTDAERDQDHIQMVITNNTQIPDRTDFILKKSRKDPVPIIIADAQRLKEAGAEVLILPCNTAHSFYERITAKIDLPLIHMVTETVQSAKQSGSKKVGILATSGTMATKIYQKECKAAGMIPVVPEAKVQKMVMSLIYDQVKAGLPVNREIWETIEKRMKVLGCDSFILGCTELSILQDELKLGHHCIDSLTVLAKSAITQCGYPLKPTF